MDHLSPLCLLSFLWLLWFILAQILFLGRVYQFVAVPLGLATGPRGFTSLVKQVRKLALRLAISVLQHNGLVRANSSQMLILQLLELSYLFHFLTYLSKTVCNELWAVTYFFTRNLPNHTIIEYYFYLDSPCLYCVLFLCVFYLCTIKEEILNLVLDIVAVKSYLASVLDQMNAHRFIPTPLSEIQGIVPLS